MTRGLRTPTLKARRELAGLTIPALAKAACCSDQTIVQLENGGNCDPEVYARLLVVLGASVAVTSSSIANPTLITTAANTFKTGDTVTIAGHTGSTPAVDGDRVATVASGTTFTVPVNVSGGGTGGTAVLAGASIGLARL
jgi:DNA-binding XRE family transcriptional regulator